MTVQSIEYQRCFGCSACVGICPVNAIEMEASTEGFLYPKVDEARCINCERCYKNCPAHAIPELRLPAEAFAGTTRDPNIHSISSSGGIFATIARDFLGLGGIVIGASMQSDFKVKHIAITKSEDLILIQGSKYVQSDLGDIHLVLKDYLMQGRKVLFSGTGCQVAGILNYAVAYGLNTDNLYTVDIVCQGVPSPLFLTKHIETTYGKVSNLRFRHRTRHELNCYAIGFEKNGLINLITPTNRDFYYSCFTSACDLRESCYTCPFATKKRVGDITLGDMNTHSIYEKELGDNRSISLIAVNTEKGKDLLSITNQVDLVIADYERESVGNKRLSAPTKRPECRNDFYKKLFLNGYDEEAVKGYAHRYSLKERIKVLILMNTTQQTRKKIKKLLGR